MNKGLLMLIFCFLGFSLWSQEKNNLVIKGSVGARYMSTNNNGALEDFNTSVSYGDLKLDYKHNSWLSFSAQGNGLFIPNTTGLEKRDAITGRGPIYEAGLFNQQHMDGQSEFALPIFNAQIELNSHFITVGRFLKDVQLFRTEGWPFPNALEGVWYENYTAENASWQLAVIYRAGSRFSGQFETVGNSIGVAPSGFDEFGNRSQYSGNVDSNVLLVGNYNKLISKNLSVDAWNYFIDGVSNTLLIEPKVHFPDEAITISAKTIYQFKVGDGGNSNEVLRYQNDDMALYAGLRVEKQLGKSVLQLNFTRISNDGRLLLPREWGIEPFYTFQRRTRIEGARDASAVMFKWQRIWSNEQGKFRFYTSVAKNKLANVTDYDKNKYHLPSHLHWEASLKFQPSKFLNGLSAEILMAKRYLADDVNGDLTAVINKANFFHFDFILNYSFNVK